MKFTEEELSELVRGRFVSAGIRDRDIFSVKACFTDDGHLWVSVDIGWDGMSLKTAAHLVGLSLGERSITEVIDLETVIECGDIGRMDGWLDVENHITLKVM